MRSKRQIPIKNSIATQLLKVVFSLYLIFAIAVTLGQMFMEYRYQKNNIHHELKDIQKTFEHALGINLWYLNHESLVSTLEGMLNLPAIVGIKIQNIEGKNLAIGGIITQREVSGKVGLHIDLLGLNPEDSEIHKDNKYNLDVFMHKFPIFYINNNETKQLGEATLYSNTSVVFQRVKLGFLLLIINAVLKTAALWFIFLWVSTLLLRKPLEILTKATANISLSNLGSFSIDTKASGRNEIKILEEVMTSMVANLNDAILKQNETESSLRESEQYLRSIFRAAPIGIGVSIDRKLIQLNEQIYKMTGYTEEEFIGQSARMLYQSNDDYKQVGRGTYKQIQDHGTGIIETCWKQKDGGIINVLISSTPLDRGDLKKGVTFAVLDITKLKGAEFALWKSEKKYKIIFEKSNDAIFIVEKNTGRYLDANHAATVLTGRTVEELKQLTTYDITPHDSHERLKKIKVSDEYEELGMVTYYRPDNSHRIAKLSKVPLDDIAVIGIARDITNDLKIEQQLRQSQKMESIGTLAGGIAHDFNNILFPILGHSEMLLQDVPKDSPFRTGLNQIHTGALRASELVKQILTFCRQKNGEVKLMKMQPIIKEILNLIRSSIPTTIEIKQNIQHECGAIKADPTQIHQIVMNLTTNAYHAMEETGGEMNIKLKKVELEESDLFSPDIKPGTYACLSISDTGRGMDNELIAKIFDPFFTTKEIGKGTGMGLSVVHGIVKSMDGAIKVYSEPDKGTEFHVYLPLAEVVKEQQTTTNIKTSIQGGIEHILLVDDEHAIIEMEQNMLERMGYQVISHTSSIEALEAFRANRGKFDLIITDMAMPNMSGDKFAVELTKIRPDIPILLCTGFSETMSAEEADTLGIKGFLLKPIVMKDLSLKIREVLDKNKTEIEK